MRLTDEARAILGQLVRALRVTAGFTGSVQFTINIRDGVAAQKVRLAVQEVIQ
jgi:hypothetical protein